MVAPTKKGLAKHAAGTTGHRRSKKTGRPKGARTQERPEITITATPCGHCGSSNGVVNRRLVREGEASGHFKGRPYGAFRHYHANCADCGRAVIAREFDFID